MYFSEICLVVASIILLSCLVHGSVVIVRMKRHLDQLRSVINHQRCLIDDFIIRESHNEVRLDPEQMAHLVQEAAPSQGRWVSAVWQTTPDPPVEIKSEMIIVKKPGKSRRKIIVGGN